MTRTAGFVAVALLLLGPAAAAPAGEGRLKQLAATVAPEPLLVAPGFSGEVTLSLAPRTQHIVEPGQAPQALFWNNDPEVACALRVKSAADGLTVTPAELAFPRPGAEHSAEVRRARLTVKVAPGTPGGRYPVVVALSYACCTDVSCLLPQTEDLTLIVEVPGAAAATGTTAAPSGTPPAAPAAESARDWGPGIAWRTVLLLLLLAGGVVIIVLARRYSLGGK